MSVLLFDVMLHFFIIKQPLVFFFSYIHLTKGTAARSIAQMRRKNNPTAARLLISSTA